MSYFYFEWVGINEKLKMFSWTPAISFLLCMEEIILTIVDKQLFSRLNSCSNRNTEPERMENVMFTMLSHLLANE